MIHTKLFTEESKPSELEKKEIIDFLFLHLEKYRDTKLAIGNAISFAVQEITSFGGFVLVSYFENEISGVVVINRTGMKEYIPENILVYIAVHSKWRGKGVGKELMVEVINHSEGNIALHVEATNPARFLYEKLGFTNPYLEMRLIKK